ncbi:hypothetical protein [Mycolicibacterium mageritense]|uniref:hypothetical protein n=1 Tax=Mycolicibacterium mageritense TaxID=53462 RepID=UPI0011D5B53A|nr:hypothetical protein [Mycolicibacterium mageritense]TXI53498.1 MAG: hypothetical protein E6Q55_35015 [Mycolicibacterium mageritense]
MSSTDTTPARDTGPRFEHHRCIEVACTQCCEPLGEDFTVHFASIDTALTEIARSEWHVSDDGVRCYECVEAHDETDARVVVVSKCGFCWPPLFSDTPIPQRCQCHNFATTITHRLRVPSVSHTHPAFTPVSCVTLFCGGCGVNVSANDEYEPHFSSPEQALQRAAADYDWVVTDVMTCCASCADSRACALTGHQFPDAADHVTAAGIEIRCCAHCTATVRNPVNDREQPWY